MIWVRSTYSSILMWLITCFLHAAQMSMDLGLGLQNNPI